MSSERFEKAYESLHFGENQITPEDFAEQKRRVEEDMVAGIVESIRGGWLTQEEGDELLYKYMQRECDYPPNSGSTEN